LSQSLVERVEDFRPEQIVDDVHSGRLVIANALRLNFPRPVRLLDGTTLDHPVVQYMIWKRYVHHCSPVIGHERPHVACGNSRRGIDNGVQAAALRRPRRILSWECEPWELVSHFLRRALPLRRAYLVLRTVIVPPGLVGTVARTGSFHFRGIREPNKLFFASSVARRRARAAASARAAIPPLVHPLPAVGRAARGARLIGVVLPRHRRHVAVRRNRRRLRLLKRRIPNRLALLVQRQ